MLVAACVMINFNHPLGNITIMNSLFADNLADMIGCIYAYQMQGTVYLFNNTFINNSATTINKLLVGSASVLQISGLFTIVQSNSNVFLNNFAEYAAIIGIYYGLYEDIGSLFLGNIARCFTLVATFSQGRAQFYENRFIENFAWNMG